MPDIGGSYYNPTLINPIATVMRDSVGASGDSDDSYEFQAPYSGQIVITLNGLSTDIDISLSEVYTEVAYSNNASAANELIVYNVVGGRWYYIDVYPFLSGVSNYNLSVALDQTAQSGTSAVYRFRNEATGSYFYTTNSSERNNLMLTTQTMMYEGPAFYVPTTATADTTQVHRFFNTQTQTHFFTASAQERTQIQSTLPHFRYEGVAFTAFTRDLGPQEEVYRFLNTQTGTHLYTSSEQERAAILAGQPHIVLEGVAYWTA
ncbi:MAG: hypothetical protein EAZ99_13460 [Alphaproteobacteria bacterium]|nr:MAG: hypothetical protein EAZ99_13460 [Alphaproteobacteria bacterium]